MKKKLSRSRMLIMNHIAQFSLGRLHSSGVPWPPMRDMAFAPSDSPPNGALVALQAAPPSKWYLSWVVDQSWPAGHAGPSWGLSSIEDGEVCNWSNVSFLVYDPAQVSSHPEWRWTDEQHEFNVRWTKMRDQENGYMRPPKYAVFSPDSWTVYLSIRLRYDHENKKEFGAYFDDWRKMTDEMMIEAHKRFVAESDDWVRSTKEDIRLPSAAGEPISAP